MQRYPLIRKDLAIGIILLILTTCIIPIYGQKIGEKPALSTSKGNIFYVGGSGSGNYTRIQDAINDSNAGDTVYVYNDSSPYYEHLVIQKSITLIGEDILSTEINGSFLDTSLDTVNITGDYVVINDFRITNNHGYYYQAAVKVLADHLMISDCIIQGNEWIGIYLVSASFCRVLNCELFDNLVAVNLVNSKSNTIQNCFSHENSDAITLSQSSDHNQIIQCMCNRNSFAGIHIQQSSENQIIDCKCQDGYGISLAYAPQTRMRNNTLLNNYVNFGIGSSSVSDFYCDIDTSNTINGKPIYFLIEQSDLLFDETMEIGFLGLVSCYNISVKNCTFSNNFEGILIVDTSNSFVENCSFINNEGHGMYIISSLNNTIENCTFRNGFFDGIFLFNSLNNTIEKCSSYGSSAGVRLESCTANTFQEQMVDQCTIGILFVSSGSNILRDSRMFHCGLKVDGHSLVEYINDVNTSNKVNGKPIYYCINETNRTIPSDAGEVILINCTGFRVSNLNLRNTSVAIELAYSNTNTISHNTIHSNSDTAIDLDGSDNNNNIIEENIIQENAYGIDVDSSKGTVIQGNMLFENGPGFSFDSSQGSMIIDNTIQNSYYGMYFVNSPQNILINNIILNASVFGLYFLSSSKNVLKSNEMIHCSLMVYGSNLAEYLNDVDTSNTVNGKPLYYLMNQISRRIPEDAGEVILINSSDCTIQNLILDSGTIGITLAYSSDSMIRGNIIKNQSMTAVDLSSGYSDNNTIQGNIIRQNNYGIDIEYCPNCTLKYNTIDSNDYGVLLYNTGDTMIKRNTIIRNFLGIDAIQTTGSTIRLNNIFLNTIYGLSVDTCSVSAQWNWWGAVTGPAINEKENGDHLNTIRKGQITYAPWHRLPVLFSGIIRFILKNIHQKNSVERHFAILEQLSFELYQNSDNLAIHGLKNIRTSREQSVMPKTVLERILYT